MPARRNGIVPRQMRTLFNLGVVGDLTDGQLLERCTTRGGEAAELAFGTLVERHGPMVLRVCRNALRDPHDAHDAFQVTFLVLIKQARSLWVRDSLAPWLHRVAYRVARRIRKAKLERRDHEHRAGAMRPATTHIDNDRKDLAAAVHDEIERLPDRFRVPVVLCDLEGTTHEQAARHLGLPIGTVKSRLMRARSLLRGRLSKRGLALTTAFSAAHSAFSPADAAVSLQIGDSTVRAALALAAGQAPGVSAITSRVAALTEEVLKTMLFPKLRIAALSLLTTAVLVAGTVSGFVQQRDGSARGPARDLPKGAKTVEADQGDEAGATSAPAYISRSRRMMIARIEEERQQANERLDRAVRAARPGDDAMIGQMRRTLNNLDDLLGRIDTVLVEAAEKYPTVFDFTQESAEPKDAFQPIDGLQTVYANAKAALDSAEKLHEKGFLSQKQLEAARREYAAARKAFEDRVQQSSIRPARQAGAAGIRREMEDWKRSGVPKSNANRPRSRKAAPSDSTADPLAQPRPSAERAAPDDELPRADDDLPLQPRPAAKGAAPVDELPPADDDDPFAQPRPAAKNADPFARRRVPPPSPF